MSAEKIGRYEIKSELGRGGMATVYQARDPNFDRDVAIKVLPREFLHDKGFRARFEREAKTIAALEHTAIVPVYDFGEQDGQPYIVMRFMPDGSLEERITESLLSIAEAAEILQRVSAALDHAHKQGVIHRDLKPANILFDQYDDAYLSDFGIAKLTQETSTFTGSAIIGTPAYMSPEQARGESDLDGRSDVYALGAILFEMLTGQRPYNAETPMGVVIKHITEPVPHILETKPDLPPDCERIIQRAMAKECNQRFATASEMTAALTQVANGVGVSLAAVSSSATTVSPSRLQQRRSWPFWLWLVGGVALIALCILAGFVALNRGKAIKDAPPVQTVWQTVSAVPATPTPVETDWQPVSAPPTPTVSVTLFVAATPTAEPNDTGWQSLTAGMAWRQRLVETQGGPERLTLVRVDPTRVRFRVLYDPAQPRDVHAWAADLPDAYFVVNASYFTPDYQTTGLLASDGKKYSASYGDYAGQFVVLADGRVELRWLQTTPYSETEPLIQALQSFPVLVKPEGQMGFPPDADEGQIARRTVIAQDSEGNILFIVSPNARYSLHAMAVYLAETATDLRIDVAMNLDGSDSTGLWLAEQDLGINSLVEIPAVIVIEPLSAGASLTPTCVFDVELERVESLYDHWYVNALTNFDLILKNDGLCPWPSGTRLALVSENVWGWSSWPVGALAVGDSQAVQIELTAPDTPQTLSLVWQLETAQGEAIGAPLTYTLRVVHSLTSPLQP